MGQTIALNALFFGTHAWVSSCGKRLPVRGEGFAEARKKSKGFLFLGKYHALSPLFLRLVGMSAGTGLALKIAKKFII
jgi:hypothetical protein